jgi:prepilin-type processing-associated H-X9-DG protein
MITRLIKAALAVSFAACGGGSALDPGAGDDPGGGTNTLFVDGNASAEARLTNARTNAEFDTEFSIRILLNQVPVTTGTVTITGASGTFTLAVNVDGENRWTGRANGYDEVYILDVESGADNIHDVRVDGPDIHVFKAPLAGATIDSTMPLPIDWSRGDEADTASIDTDRIDRLSIPDSGKYMLSAGSLEANREEARQNDIQIERTDRVVPAGATAGSEFSVRVRNEIQVVAMPNPAL